MSGMTRGRAHPVRCIACGLALAAGGCSLPISVENIQNSSAALREGDDHAADGEYDEALRSYLTARRLLAEARRDGYGIIAGEEKIAGVDERIGELEKTAAEEGLVRIGGRYIDGAALGPALADELWRMFDEGAKGIGSREQVVPETLEVACGPERDGRRDVVLSVVIPRAEDDADFDQDAWSIVRFFNEGAWGYGFSYHVGHLFPLRTWMGTQYGWGVSSRDGVENHSIAMKGKVDRLTVNVARGPARRRPGDSRRSRARERYDEPRAAWRREPYRSYSIGHAEAERLNWERANRIPDATLYGLMTIVRGETALPGATAAADLR